MESFIILLRTGTAITPFEQSTPQAMEFQMKFENKVVSKNSSVEAMKIAFLRVDCHPPSNNRSYKSRKRVDHDVDMNSSNIIIFS